MPQWPRVQQPTTIASWARRGGEKLTPGTACGRGSLRFRDRAVRRHSFQFDDAHVGGVRIGKAEAL
ncbi:MAG: hypothetical protein CMJ59_10350 [Planctomycetaceae bacterium]|nr:hypothetical protein [Planctomycetaceae bacterium]